MKFNDGIDEQIVYTNVKEPSILFKEGYIGIVPSPKGTNSEGLKGYLTNGELITSHTPFINAIDIDWNGAEVADSEPLNSTTDLLNYIAATKLFGEFTVESPIKVTTLDPGDSAKVQVTLDNNKFSFSFEIPQGPKGDVGQSAYELWKGDSERTLEEFLQSLKGEDGKDGKNGKDAPTITVDQNIQEGIPSVSSTYDEKSNTVTLAFTLPYSSGGGSDSGGSGGGLYNVIEYVYINDTYIAPDNKKVKFNLTLNNQVLSVGDNYTFNIDAYTKDGANETFLTKLASNSSIRYIQYWNPKTPSDTKNLSLLVSESGNNIYDTGTYKGEKYIRMAKVAFSGKYSDLINTPDDDKYNKIFRKSLREETSTSYADKDSILRVVYELRAEGYDSVLANRYSEELAYEKNLEQLKLYNNQNSENLVIIIEVGTALNKNQCDAINGLLLKNKYAEEDIISKSDAYKYIYELTSKLAEQLVTINLNPIKAYDSNIPIDAQKTGGEIQNRHEEYRDPQNKVEGDHCVALGWATQIPQSARHSFTEGLETEVSGCYSHSSGYRTIVNGHYTFGGGLNLNDGKISGNYSFGYGNTLLTFNNGEVAFGQYNKSLYESTLKRPVYEKVCYDTFGNAWKIYDFYNITLTDFFNGINGVDEDLKSFNSDSSDSYTYGFEAIESIDASSGKATYNGSYSYEYEDEKHSQNYTSFIKNIFNKECSITKEGTESMDIYLFLNKFIFDINYYWRLYTYKYEPPQDSSNLGGIVIDGCIVGVIAQKLTEGGEPFKDKNDKEVYEFFTWGPNSLYYKYYKKDDEDKPILFTLFSIGNGYSNDTRNNLFEITNDGNVYYKNGKKNLFELEENTTNRLTNVENLLNYNSYTQEYESKDDKDESGTSTGDANLWELYNININTASTTVFDIIKPEGGTYKVNNGKLYIYIEDAKTTNKYEKTLMFDASQFGTYRPNSRVSFDIVFVTLNPEDEGSTGSTAGDENNIGDNIYIKQPDSSFITKQYLDTSLNKYPYYIFDLSNSRIGYVIIEIKKINNKVFISASDYTETNN